ncbi:nucleotide exchange factor GrpE [Lysobacter claricitrinus]|uniref:nucleotide exchange factor GrpE n=1 Tax=Lysobacter claricitrinus TaxID=3367728 RepID=UPI0037DAE443
MTTEQTVPPGADPAQTPAGDGAMKDCCAALQAQLDAASAELTQIREDSLRERADLENQRRRVARDVDTARKFANERLLGDLLPVIDSLEAGLAQAGADAGALREGMELTLKQLLKVASDNGLVAVDPKGQPFNPDHHQAMSMVPAGDTPDNHVVQVYQKGWLLNERLLRPALVVIAHS